MMNTDTTSETLCFSSVASEQTPGRPRAATRRWRIFAAALLLLPACGSPDIAYEESDGRTSPERATPDAGEWDDGDGSGEERADQPSELGAAGGTGKSDSTVPVNCAWVRVSTLDDLCLILRSEPTTQSAVVSKLLDDSCAQVRAFQVGGDVDGNTSWYQVSAQGRIGWVSGTAVECSAEEPSNCLDEATTTKSCPP